MVDATRTPLVARKRRQGDANKLGGRRRSKRHSQYYRAAARFGVGALLLLLPLDGQTTSTESAKVFALDGDQGEPLFTFERTVSEEKGQRLTRVQFRDRDGAVAVQETVTYVDDSIVRDELEQLLYSD